MIPPSKDKISFILAAQDWCGYCVEFKPIFQKVSDKFGSRAEFFIFQNDEKMFTKFKITSFPTILIYKPKLGLYLQYNGPRDIRSFSSFVENHIVTPEKSGELYTF